MQDCLVIIDGSSLLSTQYYGNLPKELLYAKTTEEKEAYYHKIMQTSQGVYTNAVYGFFRTLLAILHEQKPRYLAVVWDVSRATFRRELYADYKANRGETPAPLKSQFALCQEALARMGVRQFMDARYEADDFAGTLAARFENEIPVRVLTKDNDYLQLVTDKTQLWLIHGTAKKTEELYAKYGLSREETGAPERAFLFTPELVEKEFGVEPASIPALKGLQGDASDNIKGVKGVGEATAAALIHEYKTVGALYDAIRDLDDDGIKRMNAMWKEQLSIKRSPMVYLRKEGKDGALSGEESARLSEQLATIKRDVPLEVTSLSEMEARLDRLQAAKVFDELEFTSLHLEFDQEALAQEPEMELHIITEQAEAERCFSAWMAELARYPVLGLCCAFGAREAAPVPEPTFEQMSLFVPETESIESNKNAASAVGDKNTESVLGDKTTESVLDDKNTALAVGDNEQLLFLVLTAEAGSQVLFRVSEALSATFLLERLERLKQAGVVLAGLNLKEQLGFLKTAAGCVDLALAAYLLNPLKGQYTYHQLASDYLSRELPTKKELLESGQPETAYRRESEVAFLTYPLLLAQLAETGMQELYETLELPLIDTLYEMECRGIRCNKEALAAYGAKLSEGIGGLEAEIYEMVGETFNINSPKQLGVILFEKMQLPYGKKTKTGYSTSADVLEKLAEEAPVVRKILEYRQLTKLKSTYADGLATFIGADGRIHGKLHQTVTATGRLSSSDPNLQNIPVRMALGREIRRVFTPRDGYVFVDADYSQIELRLLAAMSGDEKLIEAYHADMDIHRITASQVFHTPLAEVTPQQRSNAKAVNFGIVYGISSFGLGQGLNISRKEAQEYIERYFATYPRVHAYLNELVERAKKDGYVTTLFGRRRPVPELTSANFMQRNFGERVAMNAPLQGTAADIIKLAMLRVNQRLKREGLRAELLLQIHDELLCEVWEPEAEQVTAILEEEMSGAAQLAVPLVVDVHVGNSWFDAK